MHGYVNEGRTIVPDPERFRTVRKMWDLMLTGLHTPRSIARIADAEWGYRTFRRSRTGGAPISMSTLYVMFRNPFYMGSFRYDGKIHDGLHTPMVTAEEFQRVQEILDAGKPTGPKKHAHAFTGCMRCVTCGCLITAEYKHRKLLDGGRREHLYYHCTHSKDGGDFRCSERRCVPVTALESSIVDFLASVAVPPEFAQWARRELETEGDRKASESEAFRDGLDAELKRLRKQRENLNSCLIEELMEREEFERRRGELDVKIANVKKRLEQGEKRSEGMVDLVRRAINLTEYGKTRFVAGSAETKKTIFLALGDRRFL